MSETGDSHNLLFTLLVETVKDYAIFVLSPDGHVLTWNPGAKAIKGYERDEIIGKHFSIFYPREAVESGWPSRELELAAQEGRFRDEGWRVKKDGSVFWASVIITALRDNKGEMAGFAKITQDLTERRKAEERVQILNKELRARVAELNASQRIVELQTLELQKLSSELMHVQDEERRRIARELHDEIGQQLAGLKMVMVRGLPSEALEMVDSAISSVRNLSYLLHPPLLDETGLRASLHWLVDGMTKRSGIQFSLSIKPDNFPRLALETETTIFRLIQEAITNVYRHSQSDRARVELEAQTDWVTVRVRDYGRGIIVDPLGKPVLTLGVGISGMKERVRQFGGELSILPAQPGTLVEAKIPSFS